MGVWGHLPWDNDRAWDYAGPMLASVIRAVSVALATGLSEDDSEDRLAEAIVACDLVVRLAPYWNADAFASDLAAALARIIELVSVRRKQQMDVSYLLKIERALVAMQERDPLTMDGVPLPES